MNRLLFIGGLLFVVLAARAPHAQVAEARLTASGQATAVNNPDTTSDRALVDRYCVTCHNARTLSGNLSFAGLDVATPGEHPEIFEKVIRKVRAGLMPPAGMPRPERATLDGFAGNLETRLDRAAALTPTRVVIFFTG